MKCPECQVEDVESIFKCEKCVAKVRAENEEYTRREKERLGNALCDGENTEKFLRTLTHVARAFGYVPCEVWDFIMDCHSKAGKDCPDLKPYEDAK